MDAAVTAMKADTGGDVIGFAGDLSVAHVADSLAQRHPAVDILVNNLGIFEVRSPSRRFPTRTGGASSRPTS